MRNASHNNDKYRLGHILSSCEKIDEYFADGNKDEKTKQAIERNIQIIGEAIKCLSDELKDKYKDIPWDNIKGMRNYLVHEYFRAEDETIWTVAEYKIPALRDWIEGILEDLEGKNK